MFPKHALHKRYYRGSFSCKKRTKRDVGLEIDCVHVPRETL